MRILNLIHKLSGGGAERQLSYLSPMLARLGHSVHIAYSQMGPELPELPGVVLHKLTSRSNYDPYLFWQIFYLIRNIKPDLIQTWILQMDILGGAAACLNRVPWIFREPSSAQGYPLSLKHWLRVWIGSRANAIVSNSRGGDTYWEAHQPSERRFIISNGIPLDAIESISPGLPFSLSSPDTPIILSAGRMNENEKRQTAILKAMAYVIRERPIIGLLCGEGPQRSELEKLCHFLGLDTQVLFTGHLSSSAVWALMKKSALFVSLSAHEGCPNAVLEAMACECPLILSDIPAHREILDDNSALFVDPSNVQQTGSTILKALYDTASMRRFAHFAKQKVKSNSISRMAHKYITVYEQIV